MSKTVARILIAGLLLAPTVSLATPIKVDFTVTAQFAYDGSPSYDGFPAGTTASGSFLFDSSVGNFLDLYGPGMEVISGLSFNWLGVEWNDTNTSLYRAEFDALGNLISWGIGSPLTCGAGCISDPGMTDFWVDGATAPLARYGSAVEHHLEVGGYLFGTVAWSAADASVGVPEPGTLGLLGLGLLGVAVTRRRRAA